MEFDVIARRTRRGKKIPWNKGKLTGQKLALSLNEVRAIRHRLKAAQKMRDLILFSLAIESHLQACDLVQLRVRDVSRARHVTSRVKIALSQRNRPFEFDISDETREAIAAWIAQEKRKPEQYLFSSRINDSPHISTRQYARAVASWVSLIGLDPTAYGTESLRRTRPALIYRRTGNLAAVQKLLGHAKRATTARFLGIEDEA